MSAHGILNYITLLLKACGLHPDRLLGNVTSRVALHVCALHVCEEHQKISVQVSHTAPT